MEINRYSLEILFFLDEEDFQISLLNMEKKLTSGYAHRYKLIGRMVNEGWLERHKGGRGEATTYSITNVGRAKLHATSEWKIRNNVVVSGRPDWKTNYVPGIAPPARAGATDAFRIPSRGMS